MTGQTSAEIWEAFRDLAGTAPVVTIEPGHITEWSVESTLSGRMTVSPPELERVTLTYDNGRHRLVVTAYDRELALVRSFEMAKLRDMWPGIG